MNSWLDEEINDGERIKIIERLFSYISIADDHNVMQRVWVRVKDDNDIRDMMSVLDDIVWIVLIP